MNGRIWPNSSGTVIVLYSYALIEFEGAIVREGRILLRMPLGVTSVGDRSHCKPHQDARPLRVRHHLRISRCIALRKTFSFTGAPGE